MNRSHFITGSEAFEPSPIVHIRKLRDRKAWVRELAGLWSDAVAFIEALGECFILGRPIVQMTGRALLTAVSLGMVLAFAVSCAALVKP